MIITVQKIIDSFDGEIPKVFKSVFGDIDPATEIIRKQYPESMLRFEDDEPAMVGVISSIRKDRDNEVVLPEGMDDSQFSGIVLWQHDYWRDSVPHARSLWRKMNPKQNPYEIIAKTLYLQDVSVLGYEVYNYRKGEHPLGQSIGFSATERVSRGQTGYDELYKEWKTRVRDYLKEKKLKASTTEYEAPDAFYTKWELWEYSDVFIGSNPDALQIAVSKGILSPTEAKGLVEFDAIEDEETDEIKELKERLAVVEKELAEMKQPKQPSDYSALWDDPEPDYTTMWGEIE